MSQRRVSKNFLSSSISKWARTVYGILKLKKCVFEKQWCHDPVLKIIHSSCWIFSLSKYLLSAVSHYNTMELCIAFTGGDSHSWRDRMQMLSSAHGWTLIQKEDRADKKALPSVWIIFSNQVKDFWKDACGGALSTTSKVWCNSFLFERSLKQKSPKLCGSHSNNLDGWKTLHVRGYSFQNKLLTQRLKPTGWRFWCLKDYHKFAFSSLSGFKGAVRQLWRKLGVFLFFVFFFPGSPENDFEWNPTTDLSAELPVSLFKCANIHTCSTWQEYSAVCPCKCKAVWLSVLTS